MKDIALHILDIVNNSISAKATFIEISIDEQIDANIYALTIIDNGKGMSPEIVQRVTDPFYTTRTTRKVGMGIPLLKQNAEHTGGELIITSEEGKGTVIKVTFEHNNIDRPPNGDLAGVLTILITGNAEIDFLYTHKIGDKNVVIDTREIKEALDGVAIDNPQIVRYLSEMFEENINEIINN